METNAIKNYYVPKNIEYIYYTYLEVNSNYEFSLISTPSINNGNNSGSFEGEFMKINMVSLFMIMILIQII